MSNLFLTTIIFVSFQVLPLKSEAQTIFQRLKPPLVAAHQGGYPWQTANNTMVKFEQAIKDGANIMEMDLRLTKDGHVVVFHDETLDKKTKCKGAVSSKTLEEILKCPYSDSKLKIELFETVLLKINGRAVVNAEFKEQDVVVSAIKLVQKYSAYDWVYFQTKGEPERYLLARKTDNKVALLFKATTNKALDWALSLNDEYLVVIEMEKDMATPPNIQKVHAAQKRVSVNSWRYGSLEEAFSAACDKIFGRKIDIAVANNISGCVKQKSYYNQKPFRVLSH